MDCKSLYFIGVIVFVSLFFSSLAQTSQNDSSRISLDVLLQYYASRALSRSHSGILYKASLPANLSGMEASVVRLRSNSLWTRGANYNAFRFPPRIIPSPFVKRLAIVYQNLGNWSSYYYRVPGHALVTPVLGFRAYDASSNLSSNVVNLSVTGDPISIHFSRFLLPSGLDWNARCVTFNVDGTVFLANMTLPFVCSTRSQGHFSIVVEEPKRKKSRRVWKLWKWWLVVGLVCGFVGFVSMCVVCVLVRYMRGRKIRRMERKADDQGESFKTIWIGTSKMPSAEVARTKPILENGYVP